ALIGAVVLPVSLTTAAFVLYLQGTTFTTITLLGLAAAVCIVVDDVITDINAARGITAEGEAPVRAAFSAVRGPLVFATLAMLLAISPQATGNGSLLPAPQDRNLLLHVQALPGTSLIEMDRITAAAGNELQTLPGVRSVGTHVGRAIGSDQLTNVNSAEVWITLDDRADYARTKAAITTVMHGYPGLRTDLVTYP